MEKRGTNMLLGMIYLLFYVSTILAANAAIAIWGTIPVWPDPQIQAPAAVLFAGLAFTLRDLAQERAAKGPVIGAILIGAALSWAISADLALASGLAFLLSEALDMLVYTPLHQRHWLPAIALSNLVGLTVDSLVFLSLAFHSLDFLPGQLIGKLEVTLATLLLLLAARSLRPKLHQKPQQEVGQPAR